MQKKEKSSRQNFLLYTVYNLNFMPKTVYISMRMLQCTVESLARISFPPKPPEKADKKAIKRKYNGGQVTNYNNTLL